MLGSRREVETLQVQLEALARRLEQVEQQVAMARALLEDSAWLGKVADRAERLSRAAEAALAVLETRADVVGVARPRFQPKFNHVYRAETLGFVSAYAVGGRVDHIRLLVGDQDPPTESVSEGDQNLNRNYASGIVRAGEYWMIESKRDERSGFRCVYTPLR